MKFPLIRIICIPFIIGILISYFFSFSSIFNVIAIPGLIFLCLSVGLFLKLSILRIFLTIVFLFSGLVLYNLNFHILNERKMMVNDYYDQEVSTTARIDQRVIRKLSYQEIVVDYMSVWDNKKNTKLLIRTSLIPEYSKGDILAIKGKLLEPKQFDDFNYKDYLEKLYILGIMNNPKIEVVKESNNLIERTRDQIELKINYYFPEPLSTFLAGIVIGVKRYLPQEFQDNLRKTGLSHIIVVSGANITLIFLLMLNISRLVNRKIGMLFSFGTIIFYVFLVGFDPPVLRAFVMIIPVIIAKAFGRENDSLNNLLLAASILLGMDCFLISNISFQLSFLSTLGLVLLSPLLNKIIKLPLLIKENIVVTLSAQLFTLPIIVFNFKQISFIALITNTIILPFIPFLTYGGIVFVLASFISKSLAFILSLLLYFPLFIIIRFINFFGNFSFVSTSVSQISSFWVAFYYFVLVLFYFFIKEFSKRGSNEK